MDWKAIVDIGLGAIALGMAQKLTTNVRLLREIVAGQGTSISQHDSRIGRLEDASDHNKLARRKDVKLV